MSSDAEKNPSMMGIVYFMPGFFQDNYFTGVKNLFFIVEIVLFYAERQADIGP